MTSAIRTRRPMPSTYKAEGLDRSSLPSPPDYYAAEGVQLIGAGQWRKALCPLHDDREPSLSVNVLFGCFRCHGCGAHGGDIVAFYMQRHGVRFVEAAKALGAWRSAR